MSQLANSRRRLDRVTYTPLVLPEATEGGGALQTAVAVGALRLEPGEAESASKSAEGNVREVLGLMESYIDAQDTAGRLAASGELSRYRNAVLGAAADAIRTQRERLLGETLRNLESLIREYQAAHRQAQPSEPRTLALLSDRIAHVENQLSRFMLEQPAVALSDSISPSAVADIFTPPSLDKPTAPVPLPLPPPPGPVASKIAADLVGIAHEAVQWTDRNLPERTRRFTAIPQRVIPGSLRRSAVELLMRGLLFLIEQTRITASVKGSLTKRELQPLGLLHLEQLVITSLGVERGELVYSLPLAPSERVTLSHKEWSLKQEEYSRFVQDYFENYSERGVAEKTDIAVSSKSETEHAKSMSMSRPLAPGGATLADAVETQQVTDVTKEKQSQEQSRRDTKEITEKASALAIRDQKVSFTVATVSGREDFTARLYENTKPDKVMIIDYFRRMRKWRNQLYRSGIRLTYDVVLPDPGRRLRERWDALTKLDAELAAEFQFDLESGRSVPGYWILSPSFASPGVAFATLGASNNIEMMSPGEIEYMAREYGVTLPPAPNTLTSREAIKAITETPPAGRNSVTFELTIDVPEDYRPTKIVIGGRLAHGTGDQYMVADYWNGRDIRVDANEQVVRRSFVVAQNARTSRTVPVGFIVYNGAVGEARALVELSPTPEAWRKWRSAAYAAIRQGAIAKFNQHREMLRQQRAALLKELAAPDTLSLRRMEREQIMYTVLEWLFPDFGASGQMYQSLASANSVLEYGEYIKFVHDAIDWDRILVLLYPYFWDRPEKHAQKLYLDHADGTHKEFLRAGACRVMLAIKPGFEGRLVSLLDRGHVGDLAPASRFQETIEQVQKAESAFAEKRASITAPREDGLPQDSAGEPGDLIGAWYDWTPTSGMDMDVTLKDLL